MKTKTVSHTICYNLYKTEAIPLPLPNAYVAIQENDLPGYIEKVALDDVLDSYAISFRNTPHEQLLEICRLLKPQAIASKHQSNQRKQLTLEALMLDKEIRKVILQYVNRKLETFYAILEKESYPFCLEAERKEPISNTLITLRGQPIAPLLSFNKTEEGITYTLKLKDQTRSLIPCNHEIVILQDQPARILLDRKWYTLAHLNAKKLTPFFTKETVFIPRKNTKIYFEKFIAAVLKKVDVVAEGFLIHPRKKITGYSIQLIDDFFLKRLVLQVIFDYGGTTFISNQIRKSSTEVLYKKDEIELLQTKRDTDAEASILEKILALGLKNDSGNLTLSEHASTDSFELLTWLSKNKVQLQKEGFHITPITLDQKKVTLAHPEITLQTSSQNDWFDIRGTVQVGDFTLPFSDFINSIKKQERFFELPDGTFFIIPAEWLETYGQLSHFANVQGEKLQIPKSNFTVLKGLPIVLPLEIGEENTPKYIPSPLLKATLRPYQREGVTWLLQLQQQQLGACLADDMGLGKTLQTIALLVHIKEQLQPEEDRKPVSLDLFASTLDIKTYLRALIVLPSSLIFNWYQELQKFAPHFSIANYTGTDRKQLAPYLASYDIILTTYHTAVRDLEILKKTPFTYFIADESQMLKNKDSKLFKALNALKVAHKISLSGTPIENSLADLWAQMQFINPEILGSYPFFKKHFQIPIEKQQDESRTEELKALIAPFVLRRTKEQVAKDLPQLSEHIVYTEMLPEQEKIYEREKSAARNQLLGISANAIKLDKISVINTLTKLRQLSNHPELTLIGKGIDSGKFQDVTQHLRTLLKANKKVLVFSSFVKHLELYTSWCDSQKLRYCTLTGKTPSGERAKAVADFQQNEEIPLFFISIKAGGTGLNLTSASYVVILDPWWNPFAEKQAIARAHRIGQKDHVTVTKFITKNTVEEKILHLQERKKFLSEEIISIDAIPELDHDRLEAILE